MPVTSKNLKGHSRLSSNLDGITNASSLFTDRYNEEAEKLDWSVAHLTTPHKDLYTACNKYKKDNAQIHWDYLASNYEGMYLRMGYPDPKYVAKFVDKYTQKNKWDVANVKVLDLACGTGLVGKYLSESGFKNVHGIDISPNMLEEASAKCVYKELDEHTLGDPENFPEKFKN